MQLMLRLGMVALMTFPGMISAAEPGPTGAPASGQQLQQYARDLRDVGKSMQAHARTTIPEGLDKNQAARLAAQRRDLEKTADAALKLAIQIEDRERKSPGKALAQADIDGIGGAAQSLTERINQRVPKTSSPKKGTRGDLNESIKDVESMQESERNKRQMATTAFQNFEQKANQLYNLMISVAKTVGEMRAIGAGNRSGV
jgi:hypothetical protein